MSNLGTVRTQSLTFGTSGTSVILAASATDTANRIPLPRDDYTVQVTVTTTGTSIGSGQVVWQTSNDGIVWLPQGTAAGTCTNAGTSSSVAGAAIAVTAKYTLGRGVVSGTGTSQVTASMAS